MKDSRDLPPWFAKNGREKQRMKEWVNDRLDEEIERGIEEFVESGLPDKVRAFVKTIDPVASAIGSAEVWGDIEPLRKMFPDIAPFLTLPKRARGKRFRAKPPLLSPPEDYSTRLHLAAKEAVLVRAIWREAYGRVKRPSGQLSAEEIAAERWGVDEEAVHAELKKRRNDFP